MPASDSERRIESLQRFRVGGWVRDKYLNIPNNDADWVVTGATEQQMLELGFRRVGRDFPVFLHPTSHEQYALARRERKSGKGYKGFKVDTSNDVTLEQDLFRRDLTINAMAESQTGQLIDPYGGMADLEDRILRHVSEHFVEDPLRVLRVARFAARFHSLGFTIAESTRTLIRQIVDSGELEHLVKERVWTEIQSALGGKNPSIFFHELQNCGALTRLIPEFESLFCGKSDVQNVSAVLDRAADSNVKVDIRFAMLAFLAARKSHSQSGQVIKDLCSRLRTPGNFRDLSLTVYRNLPAVLEIHKLDAEEITSQIRALDGLRKPQRFKDFCATGALIAEINGVSDAADFPQGRLLQSCLSEIAKVDGRSLAEQYTGEELKNQVYAAQVAAVRKALNQQ